RFVPDHELPPGMAADRDPAALADEAAVALAQGHLDVSGPVTVDHLASATGLAPSSVTIALEALRGRGFAVAGEFEPGRGEQWCARRLLARIHSYTRERRRAAARPLSPEEWQGGLHVSGRT